MSESSERSQLKVKEIVKKFSDDPYSLTEDEFQTMTAAIHTMYFMVKHGDYKLIQAQRTIFNAAWNATGDDARRLGQQNRNPNAN